MKDTKEDKIMYIADLHIHSHYSRATSRECTPEYLELWARRKGIDILGTGDFTHPAWRNELKEKLALAEEGLYILKEQHRIKDIRTSFTKQPRFVVSGEISSIYKKNGKVRKVHSLILLKSLEDAEILSKKLETIGNIHSDGRPILGLDCHDLLEIILELCPEAIYIPAHIWTPHFSLFGAFSGFDTIEECFGDLTPYIHALETGLSSDPPMNWRVSALDSYQLISNSDAHSPGNLGREANLLETDLSYKGLFNAVQKGKGLIGTIEFFPEEGKYHYDGHRKCHLCFSPMQAAEHSNLCPVCKKKLTMGVSHRIEQLADRNEGFLLKGAKKFESLVPLPEVIAASIGHPKNSKKVLKEYETMLQNLGAEFFILREIPIEDIKLISGDRIAEGIYRLRKGEVERFPGYDGEYGSIQLFQPYELENIKGQLSLFTEMEFIEPIDKTIKKEETIGEKRKESKTPENETAESEIIENEIFMASNLLQESIVETKSVNLSNSLQEKYKNSLNAQQQQAVSMEQRAVAVIAGPGTGKTKTLISRILYLLQERKIQPSKITAVTFTNQAAEEMKIRLKQQLGRKKGVSLIQIGTFHSICFNLLKKQGISFSLADEIETTELAEETIHKFDLKLTPNQFLKQVSLKKAGILQEEKELPTEVFEYYQERLTQLELFDFDDLLINTLSLFQTESLVQKEPLLQTESLLQTKPLLQIKEKQTELCNSFTYLLVDEFQDINPIQYQLIRAWNQQGRELFVIGDRDQSIYGFRGSDSTCFKRLSNDYQELATISLIRNYRSAPAILSGAVSVISKNKGDVRKIIPNKKDGSLIRMVTLQSERAEAIFIAKQINQILGGIDMLDMQQTSFYEKEEQLLNSFSDIAVLYRTHRQAKLLEECLKKEGIPYIVAGREDFLTDKTVRSAICFFRYLLEPKNVFDLRLSQKLLSDLLNKNRLEDKNKLENDSKLKDKSKLKNESKLEDKNKLENESRLKNESKLESKNKLENIFKEVIERYQKMIEKEKPYLVLETWIKEFDLLKENAFEKLVDLAKSYKTVSEFLNALTFGQEIDIKRCGGKIYTSDAVTLTTLHGSKGLEFPIVFLTGVRNGLIPFQYYKKEAISIEDMEEERRLFYVGMTRAKERLILTTSSEPSPFLEDISQKDIDREERKKQINLENAKQMSLFDFIGN